MTPNIFLTLSLCACTLSFSACANGQNGDDGPMTLTPNGDHFVAEGVIDSSTPAMVRHALADHPGIKTIVMTYIPGSVDDEANLEAARVLRAHNMDTIVPTGGLVASGGTDLFLAGRTRRIGPGACLGVHSWASDDGASVVEGKDVPRGDPQHQLYLRYYREMGVPPDFYWYTLQVADAENIHYMGKADMAKFGILTTPAPEGPEATAQSCAKVEEKYGYS